MTNDELRALLADMDERTLHTHDCSYFDGRSNNPCNCGEAKFRDRITAALAEKDGDGWMPIETAPKDNKRPLYFARIIDGELKELDFDGIWHSESESWEMPEVYYYWASANGIEEPTHWAYQDQPLPPLPTERKV